MMAKKNIVLQPKRLSRAEGRKLLDQYARRYLGISRERFIERWDDGFYQNGHYDDTAARVASLLPLGR
jgi:hypothetical protein